MSSPSESVATPLVELVARAPDEGTRIDVFDGDLQRIDLAQNLGEVRLALAPGVYSVTFTRGNESARKTVVLTGGQVTVALSEEDAPRFATPAPVRKTSSTRAVHRNPARDLSRSKPVPPPAGHAGGSRLFVFARDLDNQRVGDLVTGLTVRDLDGALVYDIAGTDQRDLSSCWAGVHLDLDPGAYLLRSESRPGRITEQAIYTVSDWQTQVFLLSRAGGEGNERRTDLSRLSLLMAKSDVGFEPDREDMRWAEVSLSALEEHRNVPGTLRSEMRWAKFDNPILGIFAALLQLRRSDFDADSMKTIVSHLLDLVGPLPDVLAIAWALAEKDKTVQTHDQIGPALKQPAGLATPPMLAESWMHLTRASERNPHLIPAGSLSDRITDLQWAPGPWLAWRGKPPKNVDLPDPLTMIQEVASAAGIRSAEAAAPKRPGMLSAFIEKFREPAAGLGATFLLPQLRKLLNDSPDSGYLLVSRRYTDLERRIAFFASPQAVPTVQELMSSSRAITDALSGETPKDGDLVQRTVEALGVPPSTVLRGTWSVLKKLLVEPVVPLKIVLNGFAVSEARGVEAFRTILASLMDASTLLRPEAGGRHANALALLFMCYRGSPAYPSGTTHTLPALAGLMSDCDYVWSDELIEVTAAHFEAFVDDMRRRITTAIAEVVKGGKVDLPEDWKNSVLPPLTSYKAGGLLPAPRPAPTSTPAVTEGGAASGPAGDSTSSVAGARKWIRVPNGSSLELRLYGDQLAGSAVVMCDGIEAEAWPVVAPSASKRLQLASPCTYGLDVNLEFKAKGTGYLLCQIVKPGGTVFGKPYKLEVSGEKGERLLAQIQALTVKT